MMISWIQEYPSTCVELLTYCLRFHLVMTNVCFASTFAMLSRLLLLLLQSLSFWRSLFFLFFFSFRRPPLLFFHVLLLPATICPSSCLLFSSVSTPFLLPSMLLSPFSHTHACVAGPSTGKNSSCC